MRTLGRLLILLAGRAPTVVRIPGTPRPSVGEVSAKLTTITPTRIEPETGKLPTADAHGPAAGSTADTFHAMDEKTCQCLAAKAAAAGKIIDAENERGNIAVVGRGECPPGPNQTLADARFHAAVHARNAAAAEALDHYYKLADTEVKADLLARGLTAFDALRQEAAKLRAASLPAPADDDLTRRRVQVLLDAEAADAGIRRLNIDLQTRLGLPDDVRRIWPTADLGVHPTPIDADAAVQTALEQRADLRGLRGLYHGLTPDLLPFAREQLGLAAPPVFTRRFEGVAMAAAAEVEPRRQQLYNLTVERERLVTAEVRAAVIALESAGRRVGLANCRAMDWQAKRDDLSKQGAKPAEALQAELEWYRARADLMTEVTAYHQARVKLKAAQGLLGWECLR
jgi:hypothetical protein